ncbi:hypothetical protein AB8U03_01590 [Clostridium sp. Mt-5]|uniref:Uncharacterized protein n=1 Tax=Clostridium moutaii TaxID=3240932 RepID=A0ABV4BM86_9CLOT
MEKKIYADIWGDTVNVRHLFFAIIIGIAISLPCFIFSLSFIQVHFPQTPVKLCKAYALLIGMLSSLLSAFISAKLFKPKRILQEKNFSEEDRSLVLKELDIDLDKEREELKTAETKVIEEMKSLQLYELFTGEKEKK